VHDLLLVSHFFLAGVAMFLLLGLVRLSFAAAVVGGLAWMVNSFALSWQALEHYAAIEVWLPLGVLLAHVVVRRRSWPAALGLALALGFLFHGGNVLFAELSLLAVFGYAIALAIGEMLRDRASLAGNAARLGAAVALFAGLSAVSSLPTLDLSRESAREPLSYAELDRFGLPWDGLWNILGIPHLWEGDPYHINLFAGTAIALLALFGLRARAPLARFSVVLGALTLLFMLHTPVTFAAHAVLPGFDNFKPLARAAFLFLFALVVLGAFGLERALRWLEMPRRLRLSGRRVGIPAMAGVVLGALVVYFGRDRLGTSAIAVLLSLILVALLAQSLTRLPQLAATAVFATAVAGSVLAQAHVLAPHVMTNQPADAQHLYPRTPVIRYLERRPQARSLPTEFSLNGATPMVFPVRSASGYESLLPRRTQTFWRVVGDGLSPERALSDPLVFAYFTRFELRRLRPALLARAGIAYILTAPGEMLQGSKADEVELRYDGADGRVFSVDGALPRAYLVGACEDVASPQAALERFVASSFEASESVVLERRYLEESALACSGGTRGDAGTASVSDASVNSLDVDVEAQRGAWLVLTESWDDGWSATLDGREAEVLPANYAFRAVRVPAGAHTVRLVYEPDGFRLGAVVSSASFAVTVGGLAFLAWRGRLRRRVTPR
jgi:hypothetical protein